MDIIQTGISGLDSLMSGGVPAQSQVVIAGGPGSGKTLMCFEILYNNARAGKPCLFVTFEERPEDIIRNAKSAFKEFTEVDSLVEKKLLTVISHDISLSLSSFGTKKDLTLAFGGIISGIDRIVRSSNAKCVVVDSISLLKLISSKEGILAYRRAVLSLMSSFRESGVTAFLTIELPSTARSDMRFSPEFFIFDGVIVMYESLAAQKRTADIEVVKMRGAKHNRSAVPYEITPKGFRVSGA